MQDFYPLKEDSNYLIYKDGKLFSKKTNRFLKGKIDNAGYQIYALTFSSGKKYLAAHRLVAEYFIPNPKNLPVVNHIDSNRLNNNVSNLEWVTYKENTAHYLANSTRKKVEPEYYTEDLPGEKWLSIQENSKYDVSNMGRIKNHRTNRILKADRSSTYSRVCLVDENQNKKKYSIHRLVYCNFNNDYDLEGYVIDHIDANPNNNKLSNLQKITQSENNLKQARFQK